MPVPFSALLSLALSLPALAADADPADGKSAAEAEDKPWDITAAHGPTHEVSLDLREGTWMSVTVHGDTLVFDLLGDLWSMPLSGGEAKRLTNDAAWDVQPRFSPDGKTIAFTSDRGGNENLWLMNADGTKPRALTEEKVERVTEATWDPSGEWVIGRKRSVDTRSIGVTELWQYHLEGGSGIQLTTLDAAPHAGEAVVTPEHVYYSNRFGRFEYNQDPVGGLWEIVRLDRRTGETRTIVHGAGSASRPLLHTDGRTLLFVSRDRTKTLLEALDLPTGRRRVVADWLSPDALEAFALHGTYPGMALTGAGEVVLWAQGKLWKVGLDGAKAEIPFHAQGTWRLADVTRPKLTVPDQVEAKVIRWPTLSARGAIAFSALGQLWVRTQEGKLSRIGEGTGYAPAWSRDGVDLAWTSWSDTEGGRLHVTPGRGATETLPVEGQLVNPAWSEDGQELVVLRGVGGSVSPDLGAEPWYEIVRLTRAKKGWTAQVIGSTENRGPRAPRLYVHEGRVWLMEDRPGEPRMPSKSALVSMKLDGTDEREHLSLAGVDEIAVSPDFRWVAWKLQHNLHVAPMPAWAKPVSADALPAEKVTAVVGDWIGFTADSKSVTWVEGPTFKQLELAALYADEPEEKDGEKEKDEPKKDPFADHEGVVATPIGLTMPRAKPTGTIALTHARVVSMKGDEVLEDTTVVITGDRIASIGGAVPAGAKVVDVTGKTVIPGLIDVHAHLHFTAGDVLPEQEWRYQTALDFGVTTVQDPSAFTDLVFTQAERVEAGLEQGPRVYSTGAVLYGALSNDNAETPDADTAIGHVRRLKAVGADSVKVYQQSQRERRQWYVEACRAEQVLCVPEGGGDMWQNLGMVADGFHAIEHSLPVAPLYADVIGFFGGSHTATAPGTFYTQTLQVAYGALGGEAWFTQNEDPFDDERLLRHWPRRQLDQKLWRRGSLIRDDDWRYQETARDGAKLATAGVPVTLGAHGELQGLGVHWELWALGGPGALSPHDALRAATIDGARYMGLDAELGSVEAGKLADLVVLDADPLADLHNTTRIAFVVKNGEIVP